MNIQSVPIDKIHLGSRYREDYGDLEGLAQSIREIGLLQPVGTDKYFNLVFGARRLQVVRNLGWSEVPVHIVDIDSIVIGEYSENEFRKQFTASERVAIARAVEQQLPKRSGRPATEIQDNCPELKGKQNREIAAHRAGFGNEQSYRRAATVVELGTPELVSAMDKGDMSIAAAETIAKHVPKEKQAVVVALPKDERKAAVRDAREKQEQERMRNEVIALRTFERWVIDVGMFPMDPNEFWTAAGRNFMPDFASKLDQAISTLLRIKEAHPNAPKRPRAVSK